MSACPSSYVHARDQHFLRERRQEAKTVTIEYLINNYACTILQENFYLPLPKFILYVAGGQH